MLQLGDAVRQRLEQRPCRWLVTGAAGFIGSHLVEALLALGQTVVGLDNCSGAAPAKLDSVRHRVGEDASGRLTLVNGDIRDLQCCRQAMDGVNLVLHHAALVSVPASLADPLACHANNVTGFCMVLEAARQAGVRRVVYASSSAVYGDDSVLAKDETMAGQPRTPYALSKVVNEHYAATYARCYNQDVVGLRYFNVYGPRQTATGAYAAVIPLWFAALTRGQEPVIYGDGSATRDFCFVQDVVRANILAALLENVALAGEVFNVGSGRSVSLLELYAALSETVYGLYPGLPRVSPRHLPPRAGDLRHSLADMTKTQKTLGFMPEVSLRQGLAVSAKASWGEEEIIEKA